MAGVKEKLWELTQTSMESFGDKFREWKDVMNAAELKYWENNTTKRPIDILRKSIKLQ
jgi:hypothetical protein